MASVPTLLEKLDLIPAIAYILSTGFYHAITGVFRGESGGYTYKQHVTHGIMRNAIIRLSTAQLQYIAPPFTSTYEQWCKSKGITPNIITLKSGVKAFWIGSPEAKNIVIYYHGGGFSLDGGPEHLNWWGGDVQKNLSEANVSTAFLFLEYTLVPKGTYPVPIREAVESLDYVLNDLKRSPSDIILGGDSAGGNMALAVLSHIMHPSPELPKLEISGKLKGLILVAPWVSFRMDFNSAKTNAYKDIVSEYAGNKWSGDYMAGKEVTPYANALVADSEWWKDPKVEQILCVAGTDELLFDPITQWVDKYKSVNGEDSITYVVGKNEIHIAPIVEPTLGDSNPTVQGDAIKSWMKARL